MLVQKHKGHMIADTDMAQLNMVRVVDIHTATALSTAVVIPVEVKISVEAICLPASTGHLFRRSIVNEVNKIIGEKQHVWKISTWIMDPVSCRMRLESLLTFGLYIRQDAFQLWARFLFRPVLFLFLYDITPQTFVLILKFEKKSTMTVDENDITFQS